MIRIYLILLLIIVSFIAIRWFIKASPEKIARFMRIFFLVCAGSVLLYLIATGRMNWLFALLGVAIAFFVRLMPVLLRIAPDLHKLWNFFNTAKQGGSSRSGHTNAKGNMDLAEAYEILGLKPGVSTQEIINAHRRLIQKIHPDRGGSDYLAAKINQAKEILIKNCRQ